MIEVVISMLLLSLLAIAFLPMLVTSLRVSVSNSTLASATQLVATQMESIRSRGTTCEPLRAHAATLPPLFDPHGRSLQPGFDPITCPATYPATVKVRAFVSEVSTGKTLADATTSIFVKD
ncbi:hypothetical protein [Cryobacterium ruanii]|uniref:Type II secretion system protein n=1 Tax=Cryobacterium ruanii TaxID=1259197 RepID=A0A4R9APS1_9MICO|nr:hypothetical protein [Cryobacterium ruanii]TFD66916.1 hypothetical protein E3T47_07070 [Cryobacterium ruanii]